MANELLQKMWERDAPIPVAPQAEEKGMLQRLWDKYSGSDVEASVSQRDTGPKKIAAPLDKRLLDFIGSKEAPGGYNTVYGGGQEKLTSMTLNDVLKLQKGMSGPSSAVGRYQFINKTLSELKGKLNLTGKELFTPELQDRLAVTLLERRGFESFRKGEMSKEEFANELAKEWASLPVVSGEKRGQSFYAGDGLNKALVGVDEFLGVFGNGSRAGVQAQFEGESTKPLNQQEDEKAYKFTLADAAKKGLLSEEGRKAFRKKVFDEHQKAYNALSKKEKDKFYSHSGFYMKDKYPEEYEMLQLLDGPLEGLTDRQLSAIGLDVPFSKGKTRGESVGGYVFTDNPDRAFITHLGDTSTAVHEKEHLTTQDQLEPVKTLGQIGRLGEPVPQFRRLATLGESEWFKKNKVMQKVFKSSNALNTNNEFLANIAAYEASLPEGQSIYESEFASELKKKFGEEETKAILDQAVAYTLTNKGRVAETDFEFDKERIDSNDSYARQLYTYLKNKFGD